MHLPGVVKRHPLASIVAVIILVPALVFTLWTGVALHYTYSTGERAGILQKISRRGWICKTWEGELLLSAVPGTVPEKFDFTTRSDSIAQVLNRLNGNRVVVTYSQHKGLPGSCFGDTEYFVTAVSQIAM